MGRISLQHWATLKTKKNNINNNMKMTENKNINLLTTTRENNKMEQTKTGK